MGVLLWLALTCALVHLAYSYSTVQCVSSGGEGAGRSRRGGDCTLLLSAKREKIMTAVADDASGGVSIAAGVMGRPASAGAATATVAAEVVKKPRKRKVPPTFNVTAICDDISYLITAATPATPTVSPSASSSSSSVSFVVYGEPVPLSRHMMAKGHMYNPSATAQRLFAKACEASLPARPLEGPLEATLVFYFSRPKTDKKRLGQQRPTAEQWHSKRKDLDNLIKFVLDSLNAKAYLDDAQICVIKSAKFYTNDKQPKTVVKIRELSDDNIVL